MKIIESAYFEIETPGGDILSGELFELTKLQNEEVLKAGGNHLKKKYNTLVAKYDRSKRKLDTFLAKGGNTTEKIAKLETEIAELIDKIAKVEDEISSIDTDAIFKRRIELSVQSDQNSEILEAGEKLGYELVFKAIQGDIADKAKKN